LQSASVAGSVPGQSVTLLPDGRSLKIGGLESNDMASIAVIEDPQTGTFTAIPNPLHQARAWHTATMLPDGTILVVGGIGADGQVVDTTEIFHPETQSFELLSSSGLTPRVYHTATLLTQGQVLLAGGLSGSGKVLSKAELWDFRNRTTTSLSSKLKTRRYGHSATLLPNGNVLLSGGLSNKDQAVEKAEQYVTAGNKGFIAGEVSLNQRDNEAVQLEDSLPRDRATAVPTEGFIALRFSTTLRVETVNAETMTLTGPQGIVATKVIPAEGGMLAFLTAKDALLPATTYTLSLAGASNTADRQLASTVVTFTTEDLRAVGISPPENEEWTPNSSNFSGDWRSRQATSRWQWLPPLQAEPGVTALAGQVLMLNGRPLASVTLEIGERATKTDDTGRFLLTLIPPGHQVMKMDGRSASKPGRSYGIFKVGVDVTVGKTNALPYTSWMPKLDMAHAMTISSPLTKETRITNPNIPGLELRLPSQTVIRDTDGQTVSQISITPIPTDQPPFPLPPGVSVPVFFTVQPGGAQVIPPRAQLIYPNFINSLPGARIDFYNYDATEKGWYVYGQGTVSSNGKQIIPDPSVVLYEFSGAMVASPTIAPAKGPAPGDINAAAGDPVDLSTGLFVYQQTDLVLPDTIPINLTRTYRPRDNVSRPFGIGTTHPYEIFLVGSRAPYTYVDLILPDGGRIHYDRISPGTDFSDAVYEHTATPTSFYKSQVKWNGNGWDLTFRDGTVYVFPEADNAMVPRRAALTKISDRYGNSISLLRDFDSNLTRITSPNGRLIAFTYDGSNRIIEARDNIGRTVSYSYDTGGRLATVTDANGGVTQYTYDTSNQMLTIKDAKEIDYLTSEYDLNGRVTKQTQADLSTYEFAYTLNANGEVTQTDVTDPRGNIRRVAFNTSGYTLTDTYAVGTALQQTLSIERQTGTNFVASITDALGRKTAYTYDPMGNVASITRLFGTVDAVTTNYVYNTPFNTLATVTDPLNHTTTFGYDSLGNLTSVTDPLTHQTTFTYNGAGQIVSAKDANNNIATFTYSYGDLIASTDPLGKSLSRFVDWAGRVLSVTNAIGQTVRHEIDALNRMTKVTDPQQNATQFSYDANNNLVSVTDARNKVMSYHYDVMDRVDTRTDPLLKLTTYLYDNNGNLRQVIDRKQQVTQFSYDALDRLTLVTYDDSSTMSYTYDAGNRLAQVVDSVNGTISYVYNNLDRLTSETTSLGTVNYGYDAAGRLTSKTIPGQAQITYVYDNASRMTQIQQGTAVVTFAYDDANRLTSETLANGVVTQYGYDDASRLVSLTYKQGGAVLGDLNYEYDAAGRRVKMGGSLARIGLPQALSSASYNDANRQTAFGTASLSYDDDGNLTSDGTNGYTWNARNQLVAMSGPGLAASFSYDAVGRRASKTINGSTTSYLYDGANIVQEQTGGSASANTLTGGVDTFFSRTDASGTVTPLRDALGSVVALTDASGTIQSSYSYEPFGKTTATGAVSSSTQKYTGREDDGTGLYYYRNRYYSPTMQRFISEDPIGLNGGINLYAYARNNPVSYSDPFGLKPQKSSWDLTVEVLTPIAKALGGRLYIEDSTKITYIIDVHMSYTEVIEKLESIGLSYFWDPLPTHSGGIDYAANKALWAHITVGYPYGEVTRYSFNRGGASAHTEWGFRPDLTPPWITAHRDITNPRDHWRDYIPPWWSLFPPR